MKKFVLIILWQFIILYISFGKKFVFKFPNGGKQRIEALITGTYTISDSTNTVIDVTDYSQKYTTIRTFNNFYDITSDITDENYYYSTNNSFNNIINDNTLRELSDTQKHSYIKDIFGKLYIDNSAKYPTYRNVPLFPDKDLYQGETWESNGIEIQDIFNDDKIVIIPISVKYTYIGEEKKEGKLLSKFEYVIKINKKNSLYQEYFPESPNSDFITMEPRIIQISGESKTIMYFDAEIGSRIEENYERNYYFLYINEGALRLANFKDKGKRIWYPIELMKKEEVIKDIKKDLEKLENTKVEKDEKGIKISLENIRFYPDSTKLLPGEDERLKKIANILKKYKNRGVMVIGHTTDRGTARTRKILSIDRAKTVLQYLKNMDAINPEKSSYTGMGGENPIATNDTEEGRAKNRRVEIYILED